MSHETSPKAGETTTKVPTPQPLSKASRARLLRVLQRSAEGGDAFAAAALLGLARKAEQDALLAQTIAALKADA